MDRFVQTNGVQLHYIEHAGGAPALVLLPGLTANARCFDGLSAAGLSPRFHALALDLRGRGLTDQPENGYGLADHAADLVGALDALELDRAVLVGHSFGGLLAYYTAAHYPERVDRLVVLDAGIGLSDPRTLEAIRPSIERLGKVFPSWDAYLAQMRAAPYFEGWWDPLIEAYFRADVRDNPDGTVQPRTRLETILTVARNVQGEDWPAHVARIHQPVLLVRAPEPYGPPGAPPLFSADQARTTTAALADCRSIEVPGNHITMLYGAGARQIVEAITEFLGERVKG